MTVPLVQQIKALQKKDERKGFYRGYAAALEQAAEWFQADVSAVNARLEKQLALLMSILDSETPPG